VQHRGVRRGAEWRLRHVAHPVHRSGPGRPIAGHCLDLLPQQFGAGRGDIRRHRLLHLDEPIGRETLDRLAVHLDNIAKGRSDVNQFWRQSTFAAIGFDVVQNEGGLHDRGGAAAAQLGE
jgi:hypothetical protein